MGNRFVDKHAIREVDMVKVINDFQTKFNMPQSEKPGFLDSKIMDFRCRFLTEELYEFKYAVDTDNLEDAFDALIDLVYVALGTAHMMNLPWSEGFARVHEANMRKIPSSETKRGTGIPDMKKPEGWKKPEFADLLYDKAR